jgi:transcription antitermination factor NusG
LCPRYLFINLARHFIAKSWGQMRSIKGVSRPVSFVAEPARVNDTMIELLRSYEARLLEQPVRHFWSGERVLLTEGPFAWI